MAEKVHPRSMRVVANPLFRGTQKFKRLVEALSLTAISILSAIAQTAPGDGPNLKSTL
jgi:hypothetical protein